MIRIFKFYTIISPIHTILLFVLTLSFVWSYSWEIVDRNFANDIKCSVLTSMKFCVSFETKHQTFQRKTKSSPKRYENKARQLRPNVSRLCSLFPTIQQELFTAWIHPTSGGPLQWSIIQIVREFHTCNGMTAFLQPERIRELLKFFSFSIPQASGFFRHSRDERKITLDPYRITEYLFSTRLQQRKRHCREFMVFSAVIDIQRSISKDNF